MFMKNKMFRGWYVVFAAHLLLALSFGAAYSLGAFFSQIQAHFDAGSFSVASVFSLTAFIYYAVGVFSGSVADRASTRAVVIAGVVLLSLGFLVSSETTGSLSIFITSFCSLAGLGIGLVYVPTVTTVQRWFVTNRSKASGLALAGTGLGTFVGPMAAGLLMHHVSWEATMRIFAAVIAAVGIPAAMLIRGSPYELGELPDGKPHPGPDQSEHRPIAPGIGLAEAIHSGRFWWYFAAIFLGSVGLFLALVHINPYARRLGISATESNLLIGLIGVGNVAGRLALGHVGDRIGAQRLLACLTVALAVLNGFWFCAHSFVSLVLFAFFFGVANGGCISLYPAVAASWFGTANLGAILGTLYIAVGIAAVAGGSIGGLLFDICQNYALSIMFSAACAMVSAVFIMIAGGRRTTRPLWTGSSGSVE
jgi:OFA family oxalate/formate antiporter-like MFS transporter